MCRYFRFDCKSAVKVLTKYFKPEKNVIYQTYVFRQATQGKEESIDEFHTRLRGLAKHCEFADADCEIKMQIVTNCTSSRLRKKALQDPTYTLTNMLIDGRKYETSSAQADGIEEQFKTKPKENINTTTIAMSTKKKCYYCGFDYPQENRPCPAKNSVCNFCGVKGHFAKVCRSRENKEQQKDQKKGFSSPDKRRQARRNGSKKQQAKAIEAPQHQSNDESSEEDYVYTVSKEKNKKTHANVKVNGQNVHFLIDTGATVGAL